MDDKQTATEEKVARYVQRLQDAEWKRAEARLYEVHPPMGCSYWMEGERRVPASSAWIVIAVHMEYKRPAPGEQSASYSHIYPCDDGGLVWDWAPLAGSLRGRADHNAALKAAGYQLGNIPRQSGEAAGT